MKSIRCYFRVFVTLLFIGIEHIVCAQYQQLFFDRVSTKQGLSQSTVNYILQDQHGFLWFATFSGLNRYDGYSFKVYSPDESDSTSISSNSFTYLFEDSNGYIWIVNNRNNGLDRFDPNTEKFEHFFHSSNDSTSISDSEVFHVMEDREGTIWITTADHVNRFVDANSVENLKARFIKIERPEFSGQLTRTFENNRGDVYVCSDHLNLLDSKNNRLMDTGVELGHSAVISVVEYEDNTVLLGTNQDGIIKLEYDTIQKNYIKTDPGKINITPNNRTCLYLDHNQHLWIGTELDGLYRYRPQIDQLDHYLPDDFEPQSISDKTIYSIFEDNTGVLWVGTFSQGLCKYDFYRKQFMHFYRIPYNENSLSGNVISSIHSITSKELWVGLDVGGGVNRLIFSENDEPKIVHYLNRPGNPNSIPSNSTLCLVQRKNGDVWIGSASGYVSRMIPEIPFSGKAPEITNYKFERWTFSIFEDSDGILWGGTWGSGLWRYNDQTAAFDFFKPDPNNKFSLHDDIIWSIGEDDHKNIWFGGQGNGLAILTADEKNKPNPKFIHIEYHAGDTSGISNNTISAIYQAKNGVLWFCTSHGLNKTLNQNQITGKFQDFPEIKFKSYDSKDGLPSDGTVGIVEDDMEQLWISTANGISKMDPVNEKFTNYSEEDGLQSNEFWHNAYFKNSNGLIFFGGKNGFNAFNPNQIRTNPFLPEVLVTELKLFYKTVHVGDTINNQVVLKQPIYNTNKLLLTYKNNIVTFEFAALHSAQPSQNKYAYYLEGFEKQWNMGSDKRSATYTNLDPGDYIFRVKATNNDQIWSDKEVALHITVLPPWWKSLLVKITLPIVLLLIILGIFRIRLNILNQQKVLLKKTVELRTDELRKAYDLLEEKKEEILTQNEELIRHRNDLEGMVEERTKELEKAKHKAEESDRLKSSFLANMSHEIRTPMNAIMGFSRLLKKEDVSDEKKYEFIDSINSNGQSLLVLINDILDISLIESNQLVLKPKNIDVNKVLIELEDFYKLNNDKELNIEYANKSDKELTLFIDPVRFRQIMNNLLSNAYKYTHKGFIKFGYTQNETEYCFYVSDSGIGIDPIYNDSIFEHFYKIEFETRKLYRGTGIGLAICKKLVDSFNGKIWVESELRKGSNFYFTFPKHELEDKATIVPDKPVENHNVGLEDAFFVIAEDETANYEVLIEMMGIKNDRHFWGRNGKEVVDFVARRSNHANLIVLMDIKMPVMDGIEAMKKIKAIDNNIPVIALTAYALKHEEKEFMDKGFNDYVAKPLELDTLKRLISKYLKIPGK